MAAETTFSEKTFGNQDGLPSLPPPNFENTIKKLLKSLSVILSKEEFEETKKLVEDFQGNDTILGLHNQLVEKAASSKNWLEELWIDHGYLTARYPCAIWINYYAPFWPVPLPGSTNQAHAAAIFLNQVLSFRQRVYDQRLVVEKMRKKPICMNQYLRMYVNRNPGFERDILVDNPNSRHIIVFHKHRMFLLQVFNEAKTNEKEQVGEVGQGTPASIQDLYNAFQHILTSLKDVDVKKEEEGKEVPDLSLHGGKMGVLTSLGRTQWSDLRHNLRDNPLDANTLHLIESSILTLNLTDSDVWPTGIDDLANMLHNGGGFDRWYDKTSQLIVTKNRYVGVNCEHSPSDAPVQVEMSRYIRKFVRENDISVQDPYLTSSSISSPPSLPLSPLKWEKGDRFSSEVAKAKQAFDVMSDSVNIHIFHFNGFGEEELKALKMPSDFFIQNSMQLAAYRLYGHPVNTYETGSLRAFYHGRTETVRPCTPEAMEWVKSMEDSSVSMGERKVLLMKATKALKRQLIESMAGLGIDRHLFALRVLNAMSGKEMHPLFTSPALAKLFNFTLSTSNIGRHETMMYGGFAHATTDGIGACYTIQDHGIAWSLSSDKNAPPHISSEKFASHLTDALFDVIQVLRYQPPKL